MDEEAERAQRPPSSYGSMKSDEESIVEFTEDDELALPAITSTAMAGVKLNCVDYPETIFTQTTQQTKPPGADVFDTRNFDDLEEVEELEEPEDMEEDYMADSPEPPPPVEPDGPQEEEEEEALQPGKLHPEQCMPYLFKTVHTALQALTRPQLDTFVRHVITNGHEVYDSLDIVDYMMETRGHEEAVIKAIDTFKSMKLDQMYHDLELKCIKSHVRWRLRKDLKHAFKIIREGVPMAGKQERLNDIYVEAEFSTQCPGGVDPWHEYRSYPGNHPPPPLPPPHTLISANNLFRQKNAKGQPVRVVTTTGVPGVGKSVLAKKFMLDWADEKVNRDFEFVIPLSFRLLKRLRDKEESSFMWALHWDLKICNTLDCLMDPQCKYIIIMDGFDEWDLPIDWNDSRQVTNINQEAHLDAVVVNLLRGTLLPHARLWIIGRRGALSRLPPNLVDLETELQGYSKENTDQYLKKKFRDNLELQGQVLNHYKRCTALISFCRIPIVSWVVYTLMDSRFRYLHYGKFPPKLSEFCGNFMFYQYNQYLEHHVGQQSNQISWRDEDKVFLRRLGKLAHKLQEKNEWLFSEEEVKDQGMDVMQVTTYCGLCTEVGKETRQGRKKYSFVHLIIQEYMASLYIFLSFWLDGKNQLVHRLLPQPGRMFSAKTEKDKPDSLLPLMETALNKFLGSPRGRYDMMLRHLSGWAYPKHMSMMTGRFCANRFPIMVGQEEVVKLMEQKMQSHPDRAETLRVCIGDMMDKEY